MKKIMSKPTTISCETNYIFTLLYEAIREEQEAERYHALLIKHHNDFSDDFLERAYIEAIQNAHYYRTKVFEQCMTKFNGYNRHLQLQFARNEYNGYKSVIEFNKRE